MSINQGLQKYRESAKAASSSKSKATSAATQKKSEIKSASAKTVAKAQNVKATASKVSVKAAPLKNGAAKTAPGKVDAKTASKIKQLEQNPEVAIDEAVKAQEAAQEEEALQREIAEELKQDEKHTKGLVKEDFSPVNSTRDQLVLEYAPLIKYIAQKIAARLPANIELDDLMSSGVIGLMDAIEKYDSSRDNKFKTYAEFRIRGAILDELRAQDWVPRSVREKAKILERCYNKIEQEKGRAATDEEVCEHLNISQDEFYDLLNQVRSVSLLSYDDFSSLSKADKRYLQGMGENGVKAATPFSEINSAYVKRLISEAIQDLPEKQRLVLSLYYYEDLNLKEIGRVLDVTESRVSQLHTQAVLRLKAKLRTHWDEFVQLFG